MTHYDGGGRTGFDVYIFEGANSCQLAAEGPPVPITSSSTEDVVSVACTFVSFLCHVSLYECLPNERNGTVVQYNDNSKFKQVRTNRGVAAGGGKLIF